MRLQRPIVNHYLPDIPDFDQIAHHYFHLNKKKITIPEARHYQKLWDEHKKVDVPAPQDQPKQLF